MFNGSTLWLRYTRATVRDFVSSLSMAARVSVRLSLRRGGYCIPPNEACNKCRQLFEYQGFTGGENWLPLSLAMTVSGVLVTARKTVW